MRTINITILENEMKPDSTIAGMAGDNLNTKLSIEIPESWAGCTYRLKFKTSRQSAECAYISDSISLTSGNIEFLLPSSVMVAGKLQVQAVAEKTSGDDSIVVNSATMTLDVMRSIGAECDEYGFPPNYSGLIDKTLEEINEEITTQAENAAASAAAAEEAAAIASSEADRAASIDAYTKEDADARYAGALTGNASGMPAELTGVSEISVLRHVAVQGRTVESGTGDKSPENPFTLSGVVPASVRACGENLLPNLGETKTSNGITWTVKEDGSVEVSGTATGDSYFYFFPSSDTPRFWLKGNFYRSSGDMNKNIILRGVDENGAVSYLSVTKNGWNGNPEKAYGINQAYVAYSTGQTASGTLYPYVGTKEGKPYQPYEGTDYPLPTLEPLYGDGSLNDEYDGATGTETRRWGKVVLDSSLSYSMDAGAQSESYSTIWVQLTSWFAGAGHEQTAICCTHLPTAEVNLWNTDVTGILLANNGRIQFRVPKTIAASVETLKEWLEGQKTAGTPVTVAYPLATSTETVHGEDGDRIAVRPPAPEARICAPTGGVEVEYCRDVGLALEEAGLNAEDMQEELAALQQEVAAGEVLTNDYTKTMMYQGYLTRYLPTEVKHHTALDTSGQEVSQYARSVTEYIPHDDCLYVDIDSSTEILVKFVYYDSDGAYVKEGAWGSSRGVLAGDVDKQIRLVLTNDYSKELTDEDIRRYVRIYTKTNAETVTESMLTQEVRDRLLPEDGIGYDNLSPELQKELYPYNVKEDGVYESAYRPEIEAVVEQIQDGDMPLIQYGIVTDSHNGTTTQTAASFQRTMNAMKEIGERTGLSFVAHLGDYGPGSYTKPTAYGYMDKARDMLLNCRADEHFMLVGNHDDNAYRDIYEWGDPQSFEYLIRRREWGNRYLLPVNNGVVRDESYPTSRYFYKDVNGYRVICLDAIDYADNLDAEGNQTATGRWYWGFSKRQIQWLTGQALAGIPEGEDILVLSHMQPTVTYYNGQHIQYALEAYNQRLNGTISCGDRLVANGETVNVESVSYDFRNAHGRVLVCHCGHTHIDSSSVSHGVVYTTTPCTFPDLTNDPDSGRSYDTISETAFDIVQIFSDRVKLIRFGYGSDRELFYQT